jgi:hypothetical protein
MILTLLKWAFLHVRLGVALVEEFLPSMPSWPALVFSLVFSVYWYGHSHGVDACRAEQYAADLKMEKKHDKIKEHNDSIGSDQLTKRLQPYYRD